MEEDIRKCEEFINLSFLYGKLSFTKTQLYEYQTAIKNLLTRYKQLEEDNEQLDAIKNEAVRRYNFETVPKSKVIEKIKELEDGTYDAKIILQQLLKD